MTFDPSDPLARLPSETARANAALRGYVATGPGQCSAFWLRNRKYDLIVV